MYQAARGTTDILPEEQPYWRFVEKAIADITRIYGYKRIDTPIFEDTSLFQRSAGEFTDIVQKEMYTFDDRGGNSLTLKPEGTPAVCRAYIQHGMHNLPQPVKLYYVSPIFRYDRPQAGRYRQHYQFGCEAIGDDDPAIDAEVIDIAWRFYKSLGLANISLQLNSIGCKECRPAYLNILKKYYNKHANNLCADCKTRLEKNPLRLLDCKQASCQNIAEKAPQSTDKLCPACSAHFDQLQKYLGLLEIPFIINHRLVRGLDYYTRTVFEIQPEDEGGQSTLGGGGRFDGLIEELGGKPTPAAGFAAGIERIILNLKKQNISVPMAPALQVFIACLGEKARDEAIKLAAGLRKNGISVVSATGDKSLKAQLRQANTLGARYTAIIGEEEVKAGTVTLRDMAEGGQESVDVKDMTGRLASSQ
ncbi:MAG: histidine--tRNA ligase [Chloroflexi bacterium RBG_13_51_52]|nr:MAG: histidine--tRNA ligase [Chloroflexi bacterium RBG_13_51_52]